MFIVNHMEKLTLGADAKKQLKTQGGTHEIKVY